jgi:hypothetical protein
MAIVALGIAPGNAHAHPPAGAPKGPSRAAPLLKQAQAARKRGDDAAYADLMLRAKKILADEGRYSCCIDSGCDECALEGNCSCGVDLFAGKGVCQNCLDGIHAGHGRYPIDDPALLKRAPMAMEMPGLLGPWAMNREGSGTTWLPDSSPMFGRMGRRGPWRVMDMLTAFGAFVDAGGRRGESRAYSASQYMLMAQQRDARGGVIGLRAMVSADALTNGKRGYPNLFQTGESADGRPLQDRQHPHDLIMELGVSGSVALPGDRRGFLYLAPVGEPALGPVAYPHRPSAWDYPTAPISHHWLDGTHTTFGVATVGMTSGDRWKVEGSVFNGREPDENRFNIDALRFDSMSARVSLNPGPDLSLQGSYGALKTPERLEPGVSLHRWTFSAHHNRALAGGDNLASMLAVGQNVPSGGHRQTTAFLAETTWMHGSRSFFARYDNTLKDELIGVPEGTFRVQKLTMGMSQTLRGQHALGLSLDMYAYPPALRPVYGRSPVSATLFYRWRFGRI